MVSDHANAEYRWQRTEIQIKHVTTDWNTGNTGDHGLKHSMEMVKRTTINQQLNLNLEIKHNYLTDNNEMRTHIDFMQQVKQHHLTEFVTNYKTWQPWQSNLDRNGFVQMRCSTVQCWLVESETDDSPATYAKYTIQTQLIDEYRHNCM